MSLILEALRKSEAERQRGRAPGLFVEQVALRPAARSRAPAWAWALGLLFVALLLAFGWREWSRQSVPAELVAASRPGEAITQDNVMRERVAATSAAPRPAPPPQDTRDAAPAPAASPYAPPPEPVPASPPAAPVSAAPSTATPPPIPVAPAPTAPAAPTTPDIPQEYLPTLGSLDAAIRAQLPPLKLSMHVFATEPAQRFVILDGRRLGEGANPSPGVVLEEIRRDGLVLSVNGQRLLLARP